jgi:hypothetical protein
MSAPPVGGSFTLVDHHRNRVTAARIRTQLTGWVRSRG